MRILHPLPGLMTGGQETMIINIANEQAKTEDVIVMIINEDYDENLLSLFDKAVKIVLIGRPRSSKNPLWLLKLNYEIWKQHPEVIQSHYEKLRTYLIRWGYKFVYTIHDTTIPRKTLERNINTCAISKSVQKDVIERTSLRPIVVYNGIKIDNIKKAEAVKPYDKDKEYRIVQVSRLDHLKKGQHILLEAFQLLRKRGYENLRLDFIGEGDSRLHLENIVRENKIEGVRFLGNQPVEYINKHLCEYNVFVQASLFEGFGLTVAEAIAAKVPIIVSENEGPLEIIDNGKYGLAFKNGDAEDCANKIEELIRTDSQELQERVDKAWEFVNENFNVKTTAKKYIEFYKTCE